MKYSKKEAVARAVKCAKVYKEKLADTKLLIIYRDRQDNQVKYVELVFRPSNYQHLTGLIMIDENKKYRDKCAVEFYHKCLNNNLKENDIEFKADNTTPLKLDALPSLMDLTKITKIAGDYNNSRPYMQADKIIGGTNFCLAISEDEDENYFPRSALLEDIRDITENQSQVLAIFQKKQREEIYRDIRYVAKGFDIAKIAFAEELNQILQR